MEEIITKIKCDQCGEDLSSDGVGCFCRNENCIVYDKYILCVDKSP